MKLGGIFGKIKKLLGVLTRVLVAAGAEQWKRGPQVGDDNKQ